MMRLSMAAVPLVALLFISSNIFLGGHRSERNTGVDQNRPGLNEMSGRWTINVPAGATKARLQLVQHQNNEDWASIHVPLTELRGLNASAGGGSRTSRFQLVRDAGTFDFTGSFHNGRGEGEWTFKRNSNFAADMRKHGYDQFSEEQLYRLALNNIGGAYIRELAGVGYRNLSVDELNSLYSNGVNAAYINSLQSVGYSKLPLRDLLALKTNGVTDAYIKSLQNRGHKDLSVQRILSLRTNPGNQQ